MEAEVQARMEGWKADVGPSGPVDLWMLRLAVVASVQADHAVSHEMNLRNYLAERARCRWDDDRRAEAEETAANLSKDPARVASRLRRTKQGCEWMIARWRGLAEAMEAEGAWTEVQSALAADLLGTPHELRVKPLRASMELIERQVAGLTGCIENALEGLDEHERVSAELGMGMDTPRELSLAQRYRETSLRRVRWALKEVRRTPAHGAPTAAAIRSKAVLDDAPKLVALEERLSVYRDALSVRVAHLKELEPPPVEKPAAPALVPAVSDSLDPQPARLSRRARRYMMKQASAQKH
jgi:hypothetical protein